MAKTIVMFCSTGVSTALLVNKMKQAAKDMKADYNIEAFALNEADKHAGEADVILVGPQVRFALEKLRKQYPDTPVEAIDVKDYGMMNGKAVIEQAEKLMHSHE